MSIPTFNFCHLEVFFPAMFIHKTFFLCCVSGNQIIRCSINKNKISREFKAINDCQFKLNLHKFCLADADAVFTAYTTELWLL